jgi:hypothetical protein
VESSAPKYAVNVVSNVIHMTNANTTFRTAIASYASPLTSTQRLMIATNTVEYMSGVSGGMNPEYAIMPRTNNVILKGNKVAGNNIKTQNGWSIIGISSDGEHYTGYTITDNIFTGVVDDISGFATIVPSTGNTF